MLFPWKNNANSRDNAKRRLKLVIAHDRAAINPEMMSSMREEILEVVARYVDVDRDEMEFSLSNDHRITSLTANLPIRKVRRSAELANTSTVTEAEKVESLSDKEVKSESDGDRSDIPQEL